MNRRDGPRSSKDDDMDIIDVDAKEQPQLPKQMKVVSTPRIKLKYNDISDEEFRIIMKHQVGSVSINT